MPASCLSTEQIAAYVAGETLAEATGLERHTDHCDSCRRSIAAVVRGSRSGSPACAGGLASGARVGRYTVIDALGDGGMGVVYAASDPDLDRKVALKLVRAERSGDADSAARLKHEARTLALLSHPNIVTVFDAGTHGEEVFIAMELVPGTTLAAWLDRPHTVAEIVDAFVQAGRGLEAAHAAGLVHHDFKPQNVFVHEDGRVLVGDFGLARKADAIAAVGALLGTIAYMAPEQLAGEPANAGTDQFSFAVALYEALYGERPFPASTIGDQRRHFENGPSPRWTGNTRVPRWLRAALARGLALDPRERHPSVGAFVNLLARRSVRHVARVAVVVAVGLAIGGFAFGAALTERASAPTCTSGATRLTAVWDAGRRQVVHAAFLATTRPFAADAWATTERELDDYAVGWVAATNGACAATYVEGSQSAELLDRRNTCLDDRLETLDALVAVFARADPAVVEHAPRAAAELPELAACNDKAALLATVRPPRNPATTASVAAIRTRLAEGRALGASGQLARAEVVATAATDAALALGYPPLSAEALLLRGSLADDKMLGDLAAPALVRAVDLAEAGHDDVVKAEVWTELVATATMRAHLPAAHEYAAHAAAVLARLGGGHDATAARLLMYEGNTYLVENNLAKALELDRRALVIVERLYGPESQQVSSVLSEIGSVQVMQGADEAVATHTRALAIVRKQLGVHSLDVARSENNLATALWGRGELTGAVTHFSNAREIYNESLGPTSSMSARVLNNLSCVYLDLGRDADAVAAAKRGLEIQQRIEPDQLIVAKLWFALGSAYLDLHEGGLAASALEQALAIGRGKLGDDHPLVLSMRSALGAAARLRGELRASRAILEDVLARQLAAIGPNDTDVSETRRQLSRTCRALHDLPGALEHARRALEIDHDAQNTDTMADLTELGTIELELHPNAASTSLDHALELAHTLHDVDPKLRAETELAAARATWKVDPRGARALAASARAAFAVAGPMRAAARSDVERWLVTHR